jgi:hypothetical protein
MILTSRSGQFGPVLPIVSKLFPLVLVLVGAYILFLASSVLSQLRLLSKQGLTANSTADRNSIAALQASAGNMRQLITAAFYLWGIMFFVTLIGSNTAIEGEAVFGLLEEGLRTVFLGTRGSVRYKCRA